MKYAIWHMLSLHAASVHVLQNTIANFPKICLYIHVYYKHSHDSQIMKSSEEHHANRNEPCFFIICRRKKKKDKDIRASDKM